MLNADLCTLTVCCDSCLCIICRRNIQLLRMEPQKRQANVENCKQYFGQHIWTFEGEMWKNTKTHTHNTFRDVWHFPEFTSKSPKILVLFVCILGMFHTSLPRVPKYCFVFVFLGIFHISHPRVRTFFPHFTSKSPKLSFLGFCEGTI